MTIQIRDRYDRRVYCLQCWFKFRVWSPRFFFMGYDILAHDETWRCAWCGEDYK